MCTPLSGSYEPLYSTSCMLGSNQKVRNVPVSSRMTNEYSAISPSRNDQWSGKILRMLRLRKLPAPVRSSMNLLMPLIALGGVNEPEPGRAPACVALLMRSP